MTTAELSVEDNSVHVIHKPKPWERKADKLLLDSPNSTAPNDNVAKGKICITEGKGTLDAFDRSM